MKARCGDSKGNRGQAQRAAAQRRNQSCHPERAAPGLGRESRDLLFASHYPPAILFSRQRRASLGQEGALASVEYEVAVTRLRGAYHSEPLAAKVDYSAYHDNQA